MIRITNPFSFVYSLSGYRTDVGPRSLIPSQFFILANLLWVWLYSTLIHQKKQSNLTLINHRILVAFNPEIVLLFTGRRRSTEDHDQTLQEALRTRLRVVESNSQDVIQLFKVSEAHLTMQTLHRLNCNTQTF